MVCPRGGLREQLPVHGILGIPARWAAEEKAVKCCDCLDDTQEKAKLEAQKTEG